MSYHSLEIGDSVIVKQVNPTITYFEANIIFFEEGSKKVKILIKDTNHVEEIYTNFILDVKREFKVMHIQDNNGKIVTQMSHIQKLYHSFEGHYRYVATFSENDLNYFIFNGDEKDCLAICADPNINHTISLLNYRCANILWDGKPKVAFYPENKC